jgi:hypothetical protein
MKRPNETNYGWITFIKDLSFRNILLGLLLNYFLMNLMFSLAYFGFHVLCDKAKFLDYFYFSFVTSFTIGYGDFHPINEIGKILVIFHATISAVIFALIVAILSVRMFYSKDPIQYSNHILYNPSSGLFSIRVINTNKERIINPEIRLSFTEHFVGNVIGKVHSIRKIDQLVYLGKHDFIFGFNLPQSLIEMHWREAKDFDNSNSELESRFQIVISITGHNGIQQISSMKKFYSKDIIEGKIFKPLDYNKEDQVKWRNIRYRKFKNFWEDFDTILT